VVTGGRSITTRMFGGGCESVMQIGCGIALLTEAMNTISVDHARNPMSCWDSSHERGGLNNCYEIFGRNQEDVEQRII
jgi:hypothetical protein